MLELKRPRVLEKKYSVLLLLLIRPPEAYKLTPENDSRRGNLGVRRVAINLAAC